MYIIMVLRDSAVTADYSNSCNYRTIKTSLLFRLILLYFFLLSSHALLLCGVLYTRGFHVYYLSIIIHFVSLKKEDYIIIDLLTS